MATPNKANRAWRIVSTNKKDHENYKKDEGQAKLKVAGREGRELDHTCTCT